MLVRLQGGYRPGRNGFGRSKAPAAWDVCWPSNSSPRGETVVDVPSALAARARVLQSGHGRKTDGIDAHSVAIVAQQRGDLAAVSADDHSGVLRLLSDRRDELTGERRRALNRLHRLLRELPPDGAPLRLSADRAAQLLATIKPSGAVDSERKAMARQLIADVRRIDRALIDDRHRCAQAAAASATTLTDVFGSSDVLAAKILGHTGDIARFASADHYASYTPPPRRGLERRADPPPPLPSRQPIAHALQIAARVQTMHPGPGRNHYQRKRAEQKTSAEALRSLKRQLAKIVYRHLHNDHTRQAANTQP